MKSFRAWGRVGIVLLLLNEVRGVLVVLGVLAAWSHAGHAQPPPDRIGAGRVTAPAAVRGARPAAAIGPATPAPPRRPGAAG